MKQFWALIKVQLNGLLNAGFPSGKKGKSRSIWILILFIGALGLYLSGIYSSLLGDAFSQVNMTYMMPILILFGAIFMSLIFTMQSTSAFLFNGKDTDLLLALPVTSFKLVVSQLVAVYIENFLLLFFFMMPTTVVYMIIEGFQIGILLRAIAAILVLPFLITTLSLIIGYLLSLLQSKLKYAKVIEIILQLIMFGVIFFVSFQMNTLVSKAAENGASLKEAFTRTFPIVIWYHEFTIEGNIISFLKLFAISIVLFFLVAKIFSGLYKGILTNLNSKTQKSNFKFTEMKSTNVKKTLFMRELKRYFSITFYFINSFFGNLMLLGMTIYLLINPSILEVLTVIDIPYGILATGVLTFSAGMTNTTAPSISLEGNRLWILLESPVRASDLLKAKLKLNYLVTFPVLFISAIVLNILLPLNIWERICIFLIPSLVVLVQSHLGLVLDMRFPKLNAANDTAIIKQSISVLLTSLSIIFLTIGLVMLFLLVFLPKGLIGIGAASIVGILLILFILLRYKLFKNADFKLQQVSEK